MDYFNAASGPGGPSGAAAASSGAANVVVGAAATGATQGSVPSGGPMDPYAVIPQQFGNGGLAQQPPQQTVYFQFEYPAEAAADYEAYQQQQQQAAQYRAAQQAQQSPSAIYYQGGMGAPGTYFPIHSASEHDFLGPQHPNVAGAAGGAAGGGAAAAAAGNAQYGGGGNKEFMMQHQQRRGGGSQQQQGQQSGNQQNQQQQVRHQQQQQQQQQTTHFMHHQVLQVAQQQQAQQAQQVAAAAAAAAQAQQVQMHAQRIHGAPINPQQFMVPPPAILQQQQQQAQAQQMHHHQMQMQHHFGHHQAQQQQQQQQQQQAQMQHMQQGPPAQAQFQQASAQNQAASQMQQQHHQQQQQQQQQNPMHHPHHPHHHPNPMHHPHHQPPPPNFAPRLAMLRDWPIRCVVEGKYYPVIMGQNASTIRGIAHATHCRVDFVSLTKRERQVLGANDRILTVHGHAEQASKAIHRILDVIQTEAVKEDENVGADIVLRLRAHNQLCGRLIGRHGCSIKEIMNKTGTNITVAKYTEPPTGLAGLRNEELLCLMERTIVVQGPSIEAVVQAESMISAKLKKCYESDSLLRAAAMAHTLPPLGGLPPGIAGIPAGSSAGSSGGGGIPPPTLIPTPAGLIQVQHFPPSSHHPPTPNNSFLQPGMLQVPPGVVTIRHVRMWVPDTMVGALIGAKGKNIKMIIRETGASVKIEAPEEKAAREEAERLKEQQAAKELDEQVDGASSGDHQPVEPFLEDSATITSADAIEEKPKQTSERIVTVNGDDLQVLKAQSYIFSKMAEISSTGPNSPQDFERLYQLRIRSELTVPTRIIGRIIGRGGQNVRELQRITGAVVKIPEDERAKGGEIFVHEDGLEEEMTLVRVTGNMHSTHNVQVRLSTLMQEYYRSGEHRQTGNAYGLAARGAHAASRASRPASSAPGSPLEMGQLGQVPPISTDSKRNSPKSPPKNGSSTPSTSSKSSPKNA